jgi:hypothetical protein
MNILTVMYEIQSARLSMTLQCRCFLQSPSLAKQRLKLALPSPSITKSSLSLKTRRTTNSGSGTSAKTPVGREPLA